MLFSVNEVRCVVPSGAGLMCRVWCRQSLELQLARRDDELDEERGRREELERRLQRLESTPATDRHKVQLPKQR